MMEGRLRDGRPLHLQSSHAEFDQGTIEINYHLRVRIHLNTMRATNPYLLLHP